MKQKVEELIQAFQDDDWEVRRNAAYALGEIGPEAKGAVPALIQALQNQDEVGVRVSVAYALEQIGTSEAIKAAVPALIQLRFYRIRIQGCGTCSDPSTAGCSESRCS